MNTISAFVRGHPALTCFALVILISWVGGAVVVGPAHLPLNWERFVLWTVTLVWPVMMWLLVMIVTVASRGHLTRINVPGAPAAVGTPPRERHALFSSSRFWAQASRA
jgi:hypothetical protein